LVRSTIDLGHALGLRVVAEGIEDRETLDLLSAIRYDLAEGYFISRPKAAKDLAFRSDPAAARAAAFSSHRDHLTVDHPLAGAPERPALPFPGPSPGPSDPVGNLIQ
jgi:hypothetical protein